MRNEAKLAETQHGPRSLRAAEGDRALAETVRSHARSVLSLLASASCNSRAGCPASAGAAIPSLCFYTNNSIKREASSDLWAPPAGFARHRTREEKIGNGGENQESSGDEKAHPPCPHPAWVTLVQLLFGSCRNGSQCRPGHTQASPERRRYPERLCPHPRRTAGPASPAGSPPLAQTQTPRKGWLQHRK